MKRIFLIVMFALLSLSTLPAQTSNDLIRDQIIKLFIFTDEHRWDELKGIFADKVMLDYSSFTGVAAE